MIRSIAGSAHSGAGSLQLGDLDPDDARYGLVWF